MVKKQDARVKAERSRGKRETHTAVRQAQLEAEKGFNDQLKAMGPMLQSRSPHRVQAGPLKDLAAARRICDALKQKKVGCLVIRP